MPRLVRRIRFAEGGEEGCYRGFLVEAVAVAVAPDAAAVVGRVAWAAPRRPGQAAIACAPVAVTKCLTRRDSHVIR